MIRQLPLYPSYKDTGIRSIGEIPAHWELTRQTNVLRIIVSNVDKHDYDDETPVRLCNYVDVYKNERVTKDIDFERASATNAEVEKFRIASGDVIVTKDSESWDDIGVPSLVEYEAADLLCGYHLAILRPHTDLIYGPFLFRIQQSAPIAYQYHIEATGVTRYGLSYLSLRNIAIPVPPLDEQKLIATFLDYVDYSIGQLVRDCETLAGPVRNLPDRKQSLLYRYRVRLIADVVTGKLDVRDVAAHLPETKHDWHVARQVQPIFEPADIGEISTPEGSSI